MTSVVDVEHEYPFHRTGREKSRARKCYCTNTAEKFAASLQPAPTFGAKNLPSMPWAVFLISAMDAVVFNAGVVLH